jgi:predicted nucleic acid-binding protein
MIGDVIPDSSCLISLRNAGELVILRDTIKRVFTTEAVVDELKKPLPDWSAVLPSTGHIIRSYFGIDLDLGEASVISMAQKLPDVVLILDDLKARRVAVRLSLKFMGTLGVAIQAKQKGVISSIRPLIVKLQSVGLYLSRQIIDDALAEAGEI